MIHGLFAILIFSWFGECNNRIYDVNFKDVTFPVYGMIHVSNKPTFSPTAWELYLGKYWLMTAELVPITLFSFSLAFFFFFFPLGGGKDFNVHVSTNYHPQFNLY